MKKFIGISFIVIALTACGTTQSVEEEAGQGDTETPTEEIVKDEEQQVEDQKQEEDAGVEEEEEAAPERKDEPSPTVSEPAVGSDPSNIKEIPVFVEGETEMRPAQFHRSGLGYSIYVLERFRLESEEPNRDVLLSEFDPDFFTRIISHPKDVDLATLEQGVIAHAKGTIHQNTDIPLEGVAYAILEEVKNSNGLHDAIFHVAKVYDNEVLQFEVYLPLKEAAEGIGPSFWAMLKTINES